MIDFKHYAAVDAIKQAQALKRSHRMVDDCWYSCPKSAEGCCDDSQGDECNCGTDDYNKRIDRLIQTLKVIV